MILIDYGREKRMLVLNRKIGKKVRIGEVLLTVLAVTQEANSFVVKLGFQGPKHITIDRDELPPREDGHINPENP